MRLFFYGLFLALLAGCQKDPTTGTTQVSGQIVESVSKQPVGGGEVQVYHASSGGGYVPVGSAYPADATGHFTFNFEAYNKTGYILSASAPPGYITDWTLAPSLTAGRNNKDLLIPTYAPAWVRLNLVNTSHRKRYSIIIQGYSGSGEIIPNPKDTVLIRRILAIPNTSISWGIIDQATGNTSQDYQSIQPSALDTVLVRIPF